MKTIRVYRDYEFPDETETDVALHEAKEFMSKDCSLFDLDGLFSSVLLVEDRINVVEGANAIRTLINEGRKHFEGSDGYISIPKALASSLSALFNESEVLDFCAFILEENNYHETAKKVQSLL